MPRFLRLLTQNWKLKLLAVALAVLLWIVVSSEQVTSTWISVPVELEESDAEFQVIPESVPREVRVRFAGPGREFIDLAVRRPSLLLRVADVQAAEQVFELGPSMVLLPNGLEVNAYDVDPAYVRLRFREMATRDLPVRLVTGEGYGTGWTFVGPVRLTPSRVRVGGPAATVAGLESLATEPVTLADRDGAFEVAVPLDLTGVEGVELSATSVRVTGRAESLVSRRLTVPVSVGPGLALRPALVDVTMRGARSAVEAVGATDFRVVLAIDSIPRQVPPGGLAVPLRIEGLPQGLGASLSPSSVRLLPLRMRLDSISVGEGGDAADGGPAAPGADTLPVEPAP